MNAKHLSITTDQGSYPLAYLSRPGSAPAIVWLGGFRSDMRATKATALDEWAERNGRACLRFDYSGHGESGGRFEDGSISQWLADALAVIEHEGVERPVLVGSSMGGWLALLVAARLAARGSPPAGLVLLAPAVDFTERLIWDGLNRAHRAALKQDGMIQRPSAYGPPIPITRHLIEDGRRHLLLGQSIVRAHAPVHIIQGMKDEDVPWRHAAELVEHLAGDPAIMTMIKDGNHRLSRSQDIERLLSAVAGITDTHPPVSAEAAPAASLEDEATGEAAAP